MEKSGKELCYKYVEIGRSVDFRQPSTRGQAKTSWELREAKAKGDEYYDQDSERQIVSREAERQAPWEKHVEGPTMALGEALRRTAVVEARADSYNVGGSRS